MLQLLNQILFLHLAHYQFDGQHKWNLLAHTIYQLKIDVLPKVMLKRPKEVIQKEIKKKKELRQRIMKETKVLVKRKAKGPNPLSIKKKKKIKR